MYVTLQLIVIEVSEGSMLSHALNTTTFIHTEDNLLVISHEDGIGVCSGITPIT